MYKKVVGPKPGTWHLRVASVVKGALAQTDRSQLCCNADLTTLSLRKAI